MFKASVIEACDVCFRRQLETLRIDMFYSHIPQAARPHSNSVGGSSVAGITSMSSANNTSNTSSSISNNNSSFSSLSSPPLASLLPQLKSLATGLLPTEGVGYEVQDISSTTGIETLCLSILNSATLS